MGLMSLFARSNYRLPRVLRSDDFAALIRQWTEKYAWTEPDPELVDSKCEAVDRKKLVLSIIQLEGEIMDKVGFDDYYVEPPPLITSLPPVIKKILDWFLPPEKYPYAETREEKEDREIERERKRRERGETPIKA